MYFRLMAVIIDYLITRRRRASAHVPLCCWTPKMWRLPLKLLRRQQFKICNPIYRCFWYRVRYFDCRLYTVEFPHNHSSTSQKKMLPLFLELLFPKFFPTFYPTSFNFISRLFFKLFANFFQLFLANFCELFAQFFSWNPSISLI